MCELALTKAQSEKRKAQSAKRKRVLTPLHAVSVKTVEHFMSETLGLLKEASLQILLKLKAASDGPETTEDRQSFQSYTS